jgi:hypothetical protein
MVVAEGNGYLMEELKTQAITTIVKLIYLPMNGEKYSRELKNNEGENLH